MNSSENIRNAFMVVHKTYENIQKLMDHCKTIVSEKSNYISVVDKFLRYKSDNDYTGWYIKDFILLFQQRSDNELENEWRDGPIYVMEMELYNDESKQQPTVYLSKFEYANIGSWSKGCSPANHWRFYNPLRNQEVMNIQTGKETTIATPKTKELGEKYYWGLKKVSYIDFPLTDVNADNVEEKIFGSFDIL
ncbi:hypothetical protein [Ectobacillus sp. sgz5001026]|uniref:hypothetical protein n=1 Tax=Ectobacillus sp. sgz5001026 TaxID=3242473 RepID=UPI0036D28627